MAGIAGPFSAQAEYEKYYLNGRRSFASLDFDGWYAQVAYVLTGESRTYNQASGTFGNVSPNGDMGAFEVALRYNTIDLSDYDSSWAENDERGKQHDWTVGGNWYVNDNVKFQLNYIRAKADYSTTLADRTVDVLAARAQVRF